MKRELLIGCGSNPVKRVAWRDPAREFQNLTRLDINEEHKPDVVWDLMNLPLPFEDNTFDEIHAYDVLEHTGQQGDYKFFFAQFTDFWRILKPNGILCAICPSYRSPWAWGDPSHTRVLQEENLFFLQQPEYTARVGSTAMSDFRYIFKADFDIEHHNTDDDNYVFIIKAIKPSRIKY